MHRRSAFTLVELLVVVAIIIALLAILLPSMGRAVGVAEMAVCSSNQHQFELAWRAYAADHLGALVGTETSRLNYDWVYTTSGPETEQNLKQGTLWRYVQNAEIYRCPSDPRDASIYIRSYAYSGVLGGQYNATFNLNPIASIGAVPTPGRLLLMTDERDPRSQLYNLNSFVQYPIGNPNWVDLPGVWHVDGIGVLLYADGHVESYRSKDASTANAYSFDPAPSNPDLEFYQRIYDPRTE